MLSNIGIDAGQLSGDHTFRIRGKAGLGILLQRFQVQSQRLPQSLVAIHGQILELLNSKSNQYERRISHGRRAFRDWRCAVFVTPPIRTVISFFLPWRTCSASTAISVSDLFRWQIPSSSMILCRCGCYCNCYCSFPCDERMVQQGR